MKQQAAGKTAADFEGRKRDVFSIYMDYNSRNQHKMKPIPICEIPKELLA
jgi:NAD+ synthase